MAPEAKVPQESQRERILQVEEVSPSTLASFLITQESSLKIPPLSEMTYPYLPRGLPSLPRHIVETNNYHRIFTALRTLPQSRQGELLTAFFTKRVNNFPNGEKLAKFLAKLNNIDWLIPQEEPVLETLQKISEEFNRRQNLPRPLRIRIMRDHWDLEKEQFAVKPVNWQVVAMDPGKYKDRQMIDERNKASYEAGNAALGAGDCVVNAAKWGLKFGGAPSDAGHAAEWIVCEDLMPQHGYDKGNPYEPLFDGIYDKGYWFVGPICINPLAYPLQTESVIFVPEIEKGVSKRTTSECLSGPDYTGSQEETLINRILTKKGSMLSLWLSWPGTTEIRTAETQLVDKPCPDCGMQVICAHADVGATSFYDTFVHVCLNESCDYLEQHQEFTSEGGRTLICPFCKRKKEY